MTPAQQIKKDALFHAVRQEITKIQDYRREMDVKGIGYIGATWSDWDLASTAADRIVKLVHKHPSTNPPSTS